MRILCPMSPDIYGSLDKIIENGANEFYMGYLMSDMRFGSHLSRRGGSRPNFHSLHDALDAIRKIKQAGKDVFITFNQKFYLEEHHERILKDTEILLKNRIDGVIVSDISLMVKMKEKFPNINMIASTVRYSTNRNSFRFFNSFGVTKFVLSGALSIEEINDILENNPEYGFEVFIKNEKCPNIDGLCSFSHEAIQSSYRTPCQGLKCNAEIPTRFNEMACGACSIYDLRRSEGVSLKISGRPKSGEDISKDVAFIRHSIDVLKANPNMGQDEFIRITREKFKEIYGYDCEENCYYKGRHR